MSSFFFPDIFAKLGSFSSIPRRQNYGYVKKTLSHAYVRALPDAGWFLTTIKPFSPKAVAPSEQLQKGWALVSP